MRCTIPPAPTHPAPKLPPPILNPSLPLPPSFHPAVLSQVVLIKVLGKGAGGTVFSGLWRGLEVAVKKVGGGLGHLG